MTPEPTRSVAPQRITGAPILVEDRRRDSMYELKEPVELMRPLDLVDIVGLLMELLIKALGIVIIVIASWSDDDSTAFISEDDR